MLHHRVHAPHIFLTLAFAGAGERRVGSRSPAGHSRAFDRYAAADVGPYPRTRSCQCCSPEGGRNELSFGSCRQARQERLAVSRCALSQCRAFCSDGVSSLLQLLPFALLSMISCFAKTGRINSLFSSAIVATFEPSPALD